VGLDECTRYTAHCGWYGTYTYTDYPAGTGNKVEVGATGEDMSDTNHKQSHRQLKQKLLRSHQLVIIKRIFRVAD